MAGSTHVRSPIVLDPGEGEALWFNNDLVFIKASAAETGGELLLFEEHARRDKTTPLHLHREEDETFYVLEGEATFHLDGTERALGPGGFASVPRGVPHAFRVTSDVARTLVLVTPRAEAMEAFFRAAGEPAAERTLPPAGPLDMERIGAAAQSTGAVEILGPPPFAGAADSGAASRP